MLFYQSCSELPCGQMIDKYCRKSGPLGYKEELKLCHIWICKFFTCNVSQRNVKHFFYVYLNVWLVMWKSLWQIFFLASCSTPCLDIVHCFLIKHLLKLCYLNLKAKFVCFYMFKFHNNRICFSALIKSVSTLIKFALCTSCLLYIRICLLHS